MSCANAESLLLYVRLQAGLEVVAAQLQPGMPRGLFAVRMFALRPLA